jgi:hypothetical protein
MFQFQLDMSQQFNWSNRLVNANVHGQYRNTVFMVPVLVYKLVGYLLKANVPSTQITRFGQGTSKEKFPGLSVSSETEYLRS